MLSGSPLQLNPAQPLDSDGDGVVTKLDLLKVLDQLARLQKSGNDQSSNDSLSDVNSDGKLSEDDTASLVNALRSNNPILSLSLVDDSGPTNPFDRVTNNYELLLGATLSGSSANTFIEIRIDGADDDPFFDVSEYVGVHGRKLSMDVIDQLNGQKLSEGEHQIELRSAGQLFTYSFVVDRQAPDLKWWLGDEFDSGVKGDFVTDVDQVTLLGKTEPGTLIQVVETGEEFISKDGTFSINSMPLKEGGTRLTIQATDLAGNVQTLSRSIVRGNEKPNLTPVSISGPTLAVGDEEASFSVSVLNDSLVASGEFSITYFLSRDNKFDPGQDFVLDSEHASIEPGQTVDWQQTVAMALGEKLEAGEYYLGVVIDPMNELAESREDDQILIADNTVFVITGVKSELVQGVLVVDGTSKNDVIVLEYLNDQIKVLDGNYVVGSYHVDSVQGIQVRAGDGQDLVDLATHSVPKKSWVYGGKGNDTLKGGELVDHIFGGDGDDTLFGYGGSDILYGDAGDSDQLHGDGEGDENWIGPDEIDYLSLSAEVAMLTGLSANDIDIEAETVANRASGYFDREYFDLLHRHRDAWGFIVNINDAGNPDDINDGMIFTGIALTTVALNGDSDAALELVKTLRDHSWGVFNGRVTMIRHPNSFDYVGEGLPKVRERNQPVTKDGVVGAIAGLYYAYNSPGMSQDVRDAARETMGLFIDYLILHGWKTVDAYPDHYYEKSSEDSKKFANVFANEEGGPISYKGPESYALSVTDLYALKHVASSMGFLTGTWDPWAMFGASVAQVGGDIIARGIDAAGDRMANWTGLQVGHILDAIDVSKDYSFHVIPGIDWTLVKGTLSFSISDADRDNVVGAVENIIKEFFGAISNVVDYGTEIPSLISTFDGIHGRIADKILEILPDWMLTDDLRDGLTKLVGNVLPLLNGDAFGEFLAFSLGAQIARSDDIAAHLSFWPTLMVYEASPVTGFLMEPIVADLKGALGGRMDMLLYDWLAEDEAQVQQWLTAFETDLRYDSLAYAWKKPKSENIGKIVGEKDPSSKSSRIDYLVLKMLQKHGVPDTAADVLNLDEWLRHWGSELSKLREKFIQEWNNLKDDVVQFAKELYKEFKASFTDLAQVLVKEMGVSLGETARILSLELGANLKETAESLWNGVTNNLGDVVEALYTNVSKDLPELVDAVWGSLTNDLPDLVEALWGNATTNLGELVGTVWERATNDIGKLASAIHQRVTTDLSEIARGLYEGATKNLAKIAKGLWNGVTHNLGEIAVTLRDEFSAGFVELAHILRDELGAGLSEIGKVLYRELNASLIDVAKVLRNELGAGLKTVVQVLRDELGASLSQIADILRSELGATAEEILEYVYTRGFLSAGRWILQRLDDAGLVIKEWIYYDEAGEKLYEFRVWADGKLTDFEQWTADGWKEVDKWINSSGQWISQRFDSAGAKIKEWIYYDEAGEKLYEFRAWASGKLTDFEQWTAAGWKEIDKWINSSGQWISQRFDSAGAKIKEWIYYDDAGKKLYEFRAWANGKLTDFEQWTAAGWKEIDKWINSSGQWISQRFDSAGAKIKEWIYYDDAGKKLYEFRVWANGKLTDFEQWTSAGWKKIDGWVNSSGQWISQQFDSAGAKIKQWVYFDNAAQKLQEFRAWANGQLTSLDKYSISGDQVLNAWRSGSQWIEERFDEGFKYWKGVWNSSNKMISRVTKGFDNVWIEEYWGSSIRGSYQYWKGVWDSGSNMVSRFTKGFDNVWMEEYWGTSVRGAYEYWKGVWDSGGDMVTRVKIELNGNWVEERWTATREYAKKVWDKAGNFLSNLSVGNFWESWSWDPGSWFLT